MEPARKKNWYVRKQESGEPITAEDRARFSAEFFAAGRRQRQEQITAAIELLCASGYTVTPPESQ